MMDTKTVMTAQMSGMMGPENKNSITMTTVITMMKKATTYVRSPMVSRYGKTANWNLTVLGGAGMTIQNNH